MLSFSEFINENLGFELEFDNLMKSKVMVSERAKSFATTQPFSTGTAPTTPAEVEKIYKQAQKMADQGSKELSRGLKRMTQKHHKILIDVKSMDSFLDKVIARGKSANKITDVLRSAVLTKTPQEAEDVAKKMKKVFRVNRFEFKRMGQDKQFGYFGSYHLLVELSNGLITEIQIMPKRLWTFKAVAHDIYNKWRSVKDFTKETRKEMEKDMRASKAIFAKGNL